MLGWILSFLLLFKYAALFLVAFLASLAFPIPATAIIVATGAFATQGYFNFYAIIAVGLVGCVLGDVAGYLIAWFWGREVLLKIGFKNILKSKQFVKLEGNFSQHAFSAVFFSRFVFTSLGSAVNLLAGLAKVSRKRFLLFDAAGELIYMLLYAGIGYVLGSEWQSLSNLLISLSALLTLALLIILTAWLYFRKK